MSQVTKPADTIRHPFSKKKLKIIDSFSADVACAACGSASCNVVCVEPDSKNITRYIVVDCLVCLTQIWSYK